MSFKTRKKGKISKGVILKQIKQKDIFDYSYKKKR